MDKESLEESELNII